MTAQFTHTADGAGSPVRAGRVAHAARRLAAVATAGLIACGCAVNQGDADAVGDAAGSDRRSPARERVIAGIAEMVLTDRTWPSFDQARENRITKVADGSPVYAHIRASRPLGELAHPADPDGSYSFSDYPHLLLQVGDSESLRILNTCYITLTGEEARMREIVVPLAPLTYRPGQIPADCWLATVATTRSGASTYEIRLAGFAGKFISWLPVPDLLAVSGMATDFSKGAAEYAAMLRATPLRNATLVASTAPIASTAPVASTAPIASTAPVATPIRSATLVASNAAPLPGPKQDIGGSRIDLQLQTLSAALLGRRPSEAYFVDKQWTSTTDPRGRVMQQHALAAVVFKGASCSWLHLKAFRRPGASSLLDVEQVGEPIEVNCTDL